MKYRVIIKINYYEVWYEFDKAEDSVNFAVQCLEHQVECEDTKRKSHIRIEVINPAIKAEDEED